jgi:hypothetical protein
MTNKPSPKEPQPTDRHVGLPAIEVTPAMYRAGRDCLEEFVGGIGGLTNSAGYVAEAVYRAMERERLRPAAQPIFIPPMV